MHGTRNAMYCALCAGADLSRVEMAEAANVLCTVKFTGSGLHATDHRHVLEVLPGLLLCEFARCGGQVVQLVAFVVLQCVERGCVAGKPAAAAGAQNACLCASDKQRRMRA